MIKYYYVHPESGSLWWSYKTPEETPTDGLVENISEEEAIKWAKTLGIELKYSE